MYLSELIKEILQRYREHSISAYAAQMAFFLFLSIFPFLIFLFTFLGKLSIDTDAIIMILENFFPAEVQQLILDFIEDNILTSDTGLLSLSVIGTIWSASKGIRGLIRSLNIAYNKKETRNFLVMKIIDMFYTIMLVLSIGVVLVLPNIGFGFYKFISKYVSISEEIYALYNLVRTITIPTMLIVLMTLIYMFLPNVHMTFREGLAGTFFSITGWGILSYIFKVFLANFANFKVVYGSLATVIILMFWLYFSSIILIVGGEINSILKDYNQSTPS